MNNNQSEVKYQSIAFINEPGRWLLGATKKHYSIWFDSREDAQAWLKQCVETNQRCQPDLKIHGRIKTSLDTLEETSIANRRQI